MNNTNDKSDKKKKKVFKNFAEYWHLVKVLSGEQRRLLVDSLPPKEQRALQESYSKGGWEDLFMRNACDSILEAIKDSFSVDLLDLRMKILAGKPQLIQISFWDYVNHCFDDIPWEHIAYIFDGITAKNHDANYVKLSRYVLGK